MLTVKVMQHAISAAAVAVAFHLDWRRWQQVSIRALVNAHGF